MPSQLAWLDASVDEQRRMREIVALFSQRESRDELGLGQIRDGLSEALFPGTSTLHTRARYLLFIPWCCQVASRRKDPERAVEALERRLIGAIQGSADDKGLIGARAGDSVRDLPSSLYWSALRRWQVLTHPKAGRADTVRPIPSSGLTPGDTPQTHWAPNLPPVPNGFPEEVPDGFRLSHAEAAWFQERLLTAAPGTLLAHFAFAAPQASGAFAWDDPAAASADSGPRYLLAHAQAFSTVMHGAQLLYNLLLSEERKARSMEHGEEWVTTYTDRLEDWADSVAQPSSVPLALDEIVTLLAPGGVRPHPAALSFVRAWNDLVVERGPSEAVASSEAQQLIIHREKQQKGSAARLRNARRIGAWGGAAASDAMDFRWGTLRRILTDLHEGLARA